MPIKAGTLRVQPESTLGANFCDTVRETVNVQKLLIALGKLDPAADDFGNYVRDRCINPDHPDNNPTMLVYRDGVNCRGFGMRAGALDIYRMFNPSLSLRQAAEELMAGDWKITAADVAAPKTTAHWTRASQVATTSNWPNGLKQCRRYSTGRGSASELSSTGSSGTRRCRYAGGTRAWSSTSRISGAIQCRSSTEVKARKTSSSK